MWRLSKLRPFFSQSSSESDCSLRLALSAIQPLAFKIFSVFLATFSNLCTLSVNLSMVSSSSCNRLASFFLWKFWEDLMANFFFSWGFLTDDERDGAEVLDGIGFAVASLRFSNSSRWHWSSQHASVSSSSPTSASSRASLWAVSRPALEMVCNCWIVHANRSSICCTLYRSLKSTAAVMFQRLMQEVLELPPDCSHDGSGLDGVDSIHKLCRHEGLGGNDNACLMRPHQFQIFVFKEAKVWDPRRWTGGGAGGVRGDGTSIASKVRWL